jgi:hypothetical protein
MDMTWSRAVTTQSVVLPTLLFLPQALKPMSQLPFCSLDFVLPLQFNFFKRAQKCKCSTWNPPYGKNILDVKEIISLFCVQNIICYNDYLVTYVQDERQKQKCNLWINFRGTPRHPVSCKCH